MASRKRKRGSGGHPARIAERRERERARHREPSNEHVLRRTVATICAEALRCEAALDAEFFASQLLGSWWPGPLDLEGDDLDLEFGEPLVAELGRRGDAGALAALTAVAEVSGSELGLRARAQADRLRAAGTPAPDWAEAITGPEIVRTAVMHEDVFDDGSTIFVEAAHADGQRHAVGVYIDNNLGVMAKDILVADSIDVVAEVIRESAPDDGELRLTEIDPREAGARIVAAMELTDMTFEPPVGDDYARFRALAMHRAYDLPLGEVDVGVPEVSVEERDRLLADFLAAPEGAGTDEGSAEAQAVSLAIDFCSDYVDGRPLRWSPVVVELFMADWLPRKVIADDDLLDAVPPALQAWVRYAGRVREIPGWAIDLTLEAIPKWEDEMRRHASDPDTGGPARQFIAAAQEAGVDLTDEEALAAFIAGWNAGSDAA